MDKNYHGKLLLTGEYVVLDGVPALAVPTKLGQRFTVLSHRGNGLAWEAIDHRGKSWFSHRFHGSELDATSTISSPVAERLQSILYVADELQPGCYDTITRGRHKVRTTLGFDRAWGLGTSSTLIAGLADWLKINPYELLEKTFKGSGYDLACATAPGPIIYERNGANPKVTHLDWQPEWLGQTYFVYLNEKQNSREGIRRYRERPVNDGTRVRIGELTTALTQKSLHPRAAAQILEEHEAVISEALGLPTVQADRFTDFPGQIKSLGAWGGDFVWAVSERSGEEVESTSTRKATKRLSATRRWSARRNNVWR